MDFELTPEQNALRDVAQRYAGAHQDLGRRRDIAGSDVGFCRDAWATYAELGWLGAGLTEEVGGFGGGVVETALLFEALAAAMPLEPLLTSVLSLNALAALTPFDGRDALIAEIISGAQVVSFAHFELGGRRSGTHVATTARPSSAGWVLNGEKVAVSVADAADALLISARVSGGVSDEDGVGLFLISSTAAGEEIKPYRLLDDTRVGDIRLRDVEAMLLGRIADGPKAIASAIDVGVMALCAEAVGLMQATLALTREHLVTRRQFGVALSSFQALRHRMADMLVQLELSRSILFQGLAAFEARDALRARGVSAAKAFIGAAGVKLAADAIQLHGGIGVTEEHRVGHIYRRLFVGAGLLGDTAQHLRAFGDALASG